MAEEKIRCKVTDTKQAILKAYKEHISDLAERSQGSLNPTQIQETKKKTETLQRVENIASLDVPSTIQTLTTNISSTLNGILTDLESKKAALNDVEEAIKIKQEELNELYGIEKEAESLAALIEAHKSQMADLEAEYTEREKELDEAISAAETAHKKQVALWKEELSELRRQDSQARSRELEEYKYSFERQKKIELDELNDQIEVQNKQALEREAVLSQREAKITDLEEQIAQLKQQLVDEVAAAVDKAKKDAAKSAAIEKSFMEKDHKAEIGSLQAKLESAEGRVSDLLAQNTNLQRLLDSANDKVQSIAAKALEAQGNAQTIAHMTKMAESTSSGKR